MAHEIIPISHKAKDLAGRTFGKLTAIVPVGKNKHGSILWVCLCECSTEVVLSTGNLTSGHTKSCGCMARRIDTHGYSGKPVYKVWTAMLQRCNNPSESSYSSYGGRGISVCRGWHTFDNFIADMGDPPKGMTLDRIDNNGDYTPENCRWTTRKQQSRNMRTNNLITHNGKTMCVTEWSEHSVVGRRTFRNRIKRGWPIERALTEPVHR